MSKSVFLSTLGKERPLILVSNDDGGSAPGIAVLTRLAREIGDVCVIAPDGPRSGQSSALTPNKLLALTLIEEQPGFVRFEFEGSPVDCVKVGLTQLLPRRPDLILSGINHGSNASINVLYSGTMGAAMEGAIIGVRAVGFSLCDHRLEADFSLAVPYMREIIERVMATDLSIGTALNVNFPVGEVKGVRLVRQTKGYWTQDFERLNTADGDRYRLTGDFVNQEPESTDTDDYALEHGYASIVPCQADRTAYSYMESLSTIWGR